MRGNFFYKKIGGRVLIVRKEKKLSQEDLALISGVDRTYLSKIEKGKANPSIKILNKISRALRIKLFRLLINI